MSKIRDVGSSLAMVYRAARATCQARIREGLGGLWDALRSAWWALPTRLRIALALTIGLPVLLWVKSPRWGRLLDYYLAVSAVSWWMYEHPSSLERDADLLFGIGLIFGLVSIAMLIVTKAWSIRAQGLLGTVNGDAIVYLTTSSALLPWLPDIDRGVLNVGRANFYVGGSILLVSTFWLLWTTVTHRGEAPAQVDPRDREIRDLRRRLFLAEEHIRALTQATG